VSQSRRASGGETEIPDSFLNATTGSLRLVNTVNWLAHALLSEADAETRLGNLLADLVKGPARAGMTANFLLGVRRHQAIDAFTDAHPLVRRSRLRVAGAYPHTRAIIIDIFYDHLLVRNWSRHCDQPLEEFIASVYADLREHRDRFPEAMRNAVDGMLREDWLGSYRSVAGVTAALERVSRRLSARRRKPFALQNSVGTLLENFADLDKDFAEFFPLLRAHVEEAAYPQDRVERRVPLGAAHVAARQSPKR